MNVVIAIDSFKGSLSSLEAGAAVKEGISRVYPRASAVVRPLADGGEGTVEALACGMGGSLESVTVTGPLGTPVTCQYGILPETGTAILEMSGAAGITLVPPKLRNPMKTTTYGVGEAICDAIKKGCRRFIAGIGGSATNDGGIGMLQALGYGILDENGKQVPFGAEGLSRIASISADGVLPELSSCSFQIACDVSNPLCGPVGASAVFGPQKGADQDMIEKMDSWLNQFAESSKTMFPDADPAFPGTGAAGGMGFAFRTFTNASLESGIQIILKETKLEEYIKEADLVITGEGRLDGQTVMGKAPVGVAQIAKKYQKPVIAFSGAVTEDASACNGAGIDAFFPILRSVMTLEEAMETKNAQKNLAATAEQALRLWAAAKKDQL